MLRVFLFGAPRIELNGQPVSLRRSKALALLSYLATTGQPQNREALLGLLWPEFDDASARNNLRRELSLLKTLLGEEVLIADRRQVAWDGQATWVDVAAFHEQIARFRAHAHPEGELCANCAAALAAAAELYSADFTAGYNLPDSPAFDEWQHYVREELRQQLAGLLARLMRWHQAAGMDELALECGRRWVALDPLHEPAQRAVMQLYAGAGQYAAALRQYEACARLVAAEFDASPEPETVALAEFIRQHRAMPPAKGNAGEAQRPGIAPTETPVLGRERDLPAQATPFLGREQELAGLSRYLAAPHTRLITLVGPGGIGKTRLAIELARRHAGSFADGVAFVALQPVAAPAQLLAAIAEATGCHLSGSGPPRVQLLGHLRERELLLLLDNFEHLLAGAELLSDLLGEAPGLRLLVTSRELLNLQEEWSYPLGGLPVPPEGASTVASEQYDGVRLFADRARRARPDFSLAAEHAAVARICRQVEGIPLAIELAAAWAATLDCQHIAAEIARSLGFLVARRRNLPERHRSMRAVFDSSWDLLPEDQQVAFRRLAVFPGGFSAAAAAQVAETELATLAVLSDKSLLRAERGGRYQIHALLRQYAEERLSELPAERDAIRDRHRAYYLGLLARQAEPMRNGRDPVATAEIAAEIENVRLAWRRSCAAPDLAGIAGGLGALAGYFLYRGPYEDGVALCADAIRSLRSAAPSPLRDFALAETLQEQAWLKINLGHLAEARAGIEEARQLYRRPDALPPCPGRAGDPVAGLAFLDFLEGKHAEAGRLAEEYLQSCLARSSAAELPFAYFLVARIALAQGLYGPARHAAEQAHAAARAAGDRWLEAYILIDLGQLMLAQGFYDKARRYFRTSYAIREEFDDPEGKALALFYEAKTLLSQGNADAAIDHYLRSLAIYRSRGDRMGLAAALHGLGTARCALDDLAGAAEAYRDALALAHAIHHRSLALAILASASEVLIQRGSADVARELLTLAVCHVAADRETSEHAQQLLVRHERLLTAGREQPLLGTMSVELDNVVARILVELAEPVPA
jgi:predicted ATPase/DNA-binding SARP family transcriptional activator